MGLNLENITYRVISPPPPPGEQQCQKSNSQFPPPPPPSLLYPFTHFDITISPGALEPGKHTTSAKRVGNGVVRIWALGAGGGDSREIVGLGHLGGGERGFGGGKRGEMGEREERKGRG